MSNWTVPDHAMQLQARSKMNLCRMRHRIRTVGVLVIVWAVQVCVGDLAAHASPLREAIGKWTVVCEATGAKSLLNMSERDRSKYCSIVQLIESERDKSIQISTVVTFDYDTQMYSLKFGTSVADSWSVPEGVAIQANGVNLGSIRFETCGTRGCLAVLDDATSVVRSLLSSADATLLIHKESGRRVGHFLDLPLEGFNTAVICAFAEVVENCSRLEGMYDGSVFAWGYEVGNSTFLISYNTTDRYGNCRLKLAGDFLKSTPEELGALIDGLRQSSDLPSGPNDGAGQGGDYELLKKRLRASDAAACRDEVGPIFLTVKSPPKYIERPKDAVNVVSRRETVFTGLQRVESSKDVMSMELTQKFRIISETLARRR
jgi:invasion protein IalB